MENEEKNESNLLPNEVMQSRHTAEHFDLVSNWYEELKDHTWATKFVALTVAHADAITAYRSRGRELGSLMNMMDKNVPEYTKLQSMDPMEMISPEHRVALTSLRELLDSEIAAFGVRDDNGERVGVFVRMDSRSPKDAALNSRKVYDELAKEINARPHTDVHSQACVNDDVIAYWRAISRGQRVLDGEEALNLFLRSNRVYEDIVRGKLSQQQAYKANMVLRKWADIDPDLEFRTFVVKGEVTGITQYHMRLYNPKFHEHTESIKKQILEKIAELNPKIHAPNSTYTIDFVFSPDFSQCSMIEINDPPPTAGTSLFIWDNEEDRRILSLGPVTLRVVEQGQPWVEHTDMHPPLKKEIDRLRGRLVEEKVETSDASKERDQEKEKEKCSIQ